MTIITFHFPYSNKFSNFIEKYVTFKCVECPEKVRRGISPHTFTWMWTCLLCHRRNVTVYHRFTVKPPTWVKLAALLGPSILVHHNLVVNVCYCQHLLNQSGSQASHWLKWNPYTPLYPLPEPQTCPYSATVQTGWYRDRCTNTAQ